MNLSVLLPSVIGKYLDGLSSLALIRFKPALLRVKIELGEYVLLEFVKTPPIIFVAVQYVH